MSIAEFYASYVPILDISTFSLSNQIQPSYIFVHEVTELYFLTVSCTFLCQLKQNQKQNKLKQKQKQKQSKSKSKKKQKTNKQTTKKQKQKQKQKNKQNKIKPIFF